MLMKFLLCSWKKWNVYEFFIKGLEKNGDEFFISGEEKINEHCNVSTPVSLH